LQNGQGLFVGREIYFKTKNGLMLLIAVIHFVLSLTETEIEQTLTLLLLFHFCDAFPECFRLAGALQSLSISLAGTVI
jgi:hypothetical protein